MRQKLYAGAGEYTPLVVDRADEQCLRAGENRERIIGHALGKGFSERADRLQVTAFDLFDVGTETGDDGCAKVGHDPALPMVRVANGAVWA